MKKNYSFWFIIIVFLTLNTITWSQINIVRWNFNASAADAVPGGNLAPLPFEGIGTSSLLGVTASFSSGTASGGSSDPVTTTPENYGWNTTGYAALGTENKQRGVQFNVSTINYEGIKFIFDQRLSNTANNTYVVQYTTDGTNWIDAETFTFTPAETGTGDTWFNLRTVDLTGIIALNNNPNVAFRIVSAFDPTTNDYRAARSTSNYSPNGTVRLDMVTVTAEETLSISVFENTKTLLVSPNPANKGIIKLNENIDYELFDINGRRVLNGLNTNEMNTSSLNSGIYLIKTKDGVVQKLIIK